MFLNDCGAIYVHGKFGTRTQGQMIAGNQITGGIGFFRGTFKDSPSAKAIYLDIGATGFDVANNVIRGTNSKNGAIFVHAGNHNTIRGNVVEANYGPAIGLYYNIMACRNGELRPMDQNRVTDNTLSTNASAFGTILLADYNLGQAQNLAKFAGNEFPRGGAVPVLVNQTKAPGTYCSWGSVGD